MAFLAANVVSVPEEENNFRAKRPRVRPIMEATKSDLDEIKSLLDQGKATEAEVRYLREWRVADTMIRASGRTELH